MYADSRHPGLKKYRDIRTKEKALHALRKQIRVNNPLLTDSQVSAVAHGSFEAKNAVAKKGKK